MRCDECCSGLVVSLPNILWLVQLWMPEFSLCYYTTVLSVIFCPRAAATSSLQLFNAILYALTLLPYEVTYP